MEIYIILILSAFIAALISGAAGFGGSLLYMENLSISPLMQLILDS